ncbi:hypothetical protein AGOR_G00117700 [Albula goreensis]|uniref:Nucleolar 27S pre-rRNA processing Urb2/Npa2 C-terminal domain-containing protein n=1 Tax=Albula goreensis TaxID=1534307 RepID=A0A8T3DEK7_9TELE|nr:hypothetical protein AGOR_G00117700 [Albula goreensis]
MAAIYSGIHLKLKSPRTPWTDKLKLARFAWISPQCFLPNKEQVLFDWTSHALTGYYSKKVEFPQDVLEGLWAYLNDILHSKKLQKVLSQGKTLSLRLALAQVINDRILEFASGMSPLSVSTVLSCCKGILSSPVLSVTYTTRYELLVEFLTRLCGLACPRPSQQPEAHVQPQVFELLLLALNSYLVVQRQQANPNRVFTQVTTHLLQPLLLLRHLLTTHVWPVEDDIRARQHLSREIRGKVDSVLQSALYMPDHLNSYKEELLPNKELQASTRGPARKGVLTPVNTILQKLCDPGLCDPTLHFTVRANSIPLLFKFAMDAFCRTVDNKSICFHLLTRFVTALDFTVELTTNDGFNPENWSLALLALENLLNFTLSGDLYNVAADRIQHGEEQFNFYRKVAQLLLYSAQPGIPAWYRCLKALLTLNHLVVEPDLDELVSSAWVDSDCIEARVKKARETLVIAVIQTYTKLRQLPRLFQEVLAVVCRPAADELRQPLLSAALQRNLNQCLLDSPPNQSLEMWRLILERMNSYLLPDLEGKEDMALKLLSLSDLLHVVLFSVRSLDASSPLPILRQTQTLMEETLTLIALLFRLLSGKAQEVPWFQSTHRAVLLLSYTWVEVDTLFEIHCSRYKRSPTEKGFSLLCGVEMDDWEKVLSVSHCCGPLSEHLQMLLTLQRMKKLLLSTDAFRDGDIQHAMCLDAQFIIKMGKMLFCQASEELWDMQLNSVNNNTFPVAHWFLVTSNLGLIAPYLSDGDMSHIADVLLDSLLQEYYPDVPEKEVTHLSVTQISKQLLDSTVLVELSPLYSIIVRSLLQKIVKLLCSSEQGSQCQALLRFGEELQATVQVEKEAADTEARGSSTEISPVWKRLESISQAVVQTTKANTSLTLTGPEMKRLVQFLEVIRALNPDAMSPEGHSECFLFLFFMATKLQSQCDAEPANVTRLLTEIYCLMTSMQSGRNEGSILKVVHGSELLEAVISSVSSLSKSMTQTVDSPAWLEFVQAVQSFLQCLLQVIIRRRKSVRLNLEKFTSFLVDGEVAASALSSPQDELEAGSLVSLQLLLASLSMLCQTMTANLGESSKLDETLLKLSERAVCTLGPALQLCLNGQACGLLGQAFSVDVVTVMVQAELSHATSDGEEEDKLKGLTHMSLYRSFAQQVLRELSSAPRPMDFLFSSLNFLAAYYSAEGMFREANLTELFVSILQNLKNLMSASWLTASELQELEAPVMEVLAQLVSRITQEQLHVLLEALKEGLSSTPVRSGHFKDVLSAVTLTKLLVSCPLPETCHKAFWFLVPQIISALVFIAQECGKDPVLAGGLAVPALDALTVVLRQGEGVLSNPHHVGLVFGALQLVPLELPSSKDFHSVFHAVHELLFAIIQCHPQVMLKAAPSFLNCFYRLVVSAMQEGRQRAEGERGCEAESEVSVKCAMLVERMYTHIASVAEGFTVLSSFIVAQYVSELQRVTLQPEIKSHLTEGIYKILDLCVEQDIKFLSSTLPHGVREVFNELYSSYTHYHKTQRQGEAKYTV